VSAAEHIEQARAFLTAGRLEEAMTAARLALTKEPGNLEAMLFSARIVRRGGNAEAARGLYAVILEHHPDAAEAEAGIGACLGLQGRYSLAEVHFRRAVLLKPDYFEAWSFLAEALVEQGRTADAMDCFEQSLSIRPYNDSAISKYLFYAVFDPRYGAARFARLNQDWGTKIAEGAVVLPPKNRPINGRKIRIGYLSDEFYECVTARFLAPVLAQYDKARFHLTGYARNATQDATTAELAGLVEAWRDLSAMDDGAAAKAIHDDEIDILVLCTSYRAETRTILAFKPAPIQVCYSNLVSTTGLSAVDYLITEDATDPKGSDRFYVENLVRVTNRNIYQPPSAAPDPGPPPCLETKKVTFASFNNLGKVTPAAVALWSRILKAVPGSCLVMKSVNRLSDSGAREYFAGLFLSHGIAADRLEFLAGEGDLIAHLGQYRNVDIALDPFPCNGGTTSCEALWMGVPFVTMAGETFMGRQGVNYLGKLGLNDLIATNAEAYLAATVKLAGDEARLKALRGSLREQVTTCLFDPTSHVMELETAYTEMMGKLQAGEKPAPFRVRGEQTLV
jgi:protein O-GlcNAc transferase